MDVIGNLRYLKKIYDRRNDKDFINKVNGIESADCIFVHHLGNKNEDKMICFINIDTPYSGWFGMMNNILLQLAYADKYSMTPVISLAKSELYSDEDDYRNLDLFEYYYVQPTSISIEEALSSKNVVKSKFYNSPYGYDAFRNYDQDSAETQFMAGLIEKYIKFNNITLEHVKASSDKIINGKRTLGVHVRGTDYKAGYDNHPMYIPIQDYIATVKEILSAELYDQIFVASDEEDAVTAFEDEFGDLVVFNNAYRASGDTNVGIHTSTLQEKRKNHKYLLGLEVLTDMYTLSCCDGIIGCQSNVVYHAIINKLSRKEKYSDLRILFRGMYKSDKNSVKEMKKRSSVK